MLSYSPTDHRYVALSRGKASHRAHLWLRSTADLHHRSGRGCNWGKLMSSQHWRAQAAHQCIAPTRPAGACHPCQAQSSLEQASQL